MELPSLRLGLGESLAQWQDPYTHLLCLGKSGTGKSNLMINMIQQDSYYRTAKVIIDPSGHLAGDAWSIAKGKALYCSLEHPVSLNPMLLPYDDDTISDLVSECVNQVIEKTTSNQSLTAKMRSILDESIKWNLERNRKSLLHVRDHIANLKGDGQTRDGILARLNFLLSNKKMERLICGKDSINWGELIDQERTFVLDCHAMSEEKLIFVGSLVTHQIKSYFRHEKRKEYRPLRVYIDEAHNFLSQNILSILKEARKYKFSFVMMTVDFSSIQPSLVHAMCNVGTLVSFKVGYREAQILAREMDLAPQDLMSLERYWLAYLTPRDKGFCKAPRPPYIRKVEIKKAEPQRKPKWKGWFPLEEAG